MNIEKYIKAARGRLRMADIPTLSLFNASQSLASVILACQFLADIVDDQERRIEQLETALKENNHD